MPEQKKPLIVGLTGQTGAGKTALSKIFEENGFAVINADSIARNVSTDPAVLAQLATAFGTEILNDDGSLNRPILAGKAFSDQQQLQLLNGIMNPPILTQLTKQLDALVTDGQQNILLDAPTLFESGADKLCSKKIAVLASEEIRKSRIMRRDQLTQRQAEERMSSQNSDRYYIWRADYILRNNTSDNELCAQGEALVKHLTSAKKHSSLKVLLLWTAIILAAIFAISGIYRLIFTCMYPQKYANFVIPYANEYEVDPNLVYAVIKCESSFRPNVVSKAQARGLMQITEEAYNWAKSKMGETEIHQYDDLFDPELNIKYGTFILSMLLQEFDSSENALSAYHAGWGNVKKWLADERYSDDGITIHTIPFPTTNKYVDNVLGTKEMYKKLYS